MNEASALQDAVLHQMALSSVLYFSGGGGVRRFDMPIVNTVIAPDGFSRSAITPGGTFPGTLIKAQKGDSVEIVTHNRLSDTNMRRSYSIHWHGFFQARTSGMDGPAFVNQCPVAPGDDFTYSFDLAEQTGSYWYHSHLSTQYCDGFRGVFIVYGQYFLLIALIRFTLLSLDPKDPLKGLYDVDDESTIITLADWYHVFAPDGQNDFFKTGSVPVPDSGLINGRGRYVGGPLVDYAVINVVPGKRYRFRLVSIACRPFFTFSIDNHLMDAMELDGVEHDPVTVENVDVYAAQRVSVIVKADQPVGNYWIRAPLTGGSPTRNPNLDPNLTRAILRYAGAPKAEPTTERTAGVKLDDGLMHPIASEGPGKLGNGVADVHYVLNIAQPNPPFFDINGISYLSPPVPVLLQILSGAFQPQDFLPSEQVFLLPPNKTIDISIPGTGATRSIVSFPYPLTQLYPDFWLKVHGHNFDVIRESNTDEFNFVNPARRDVVPINGGNTTFRFFTDNPGAWFLHCHIDWHLEAGLAIAFAEAPADNIAGPHAQITLRNGRLCAQSTGRYHRKSSRLLFSYLKLYIMYASCKATITTICDFYNLYARAGVGRTN
ncbi:laccase [Hymenopellis radicata]|nr:laccase [Hymenopellis radicata]